MQQPKQEVFWRTRLSPAVEFQVYNDVGKRALSPSIDICVAQAPLSGGTLAAVEALGVPSTTLYLASFLALLQRRTEETDLCIFLTDPNPSCVALQLDETVQFSKLLRTVGQLIGEAALHNGAFSFADLASSLGLRAFSHVSFGVVERYNTCNLDHWATLFASSSDAMHLHLSVQLGTPCSVVAHYRGDLFRPDTISRMLNHYQRILACVLTPPPQQGGSTPPFRSPAVGLHTPIGELPLLTAAEEGAVLSLSHTTAFPVTTTDTTDTAANSDVAMAHPDIVCLPPHTPPTAVLEGAVLATAQPSPPPPPSRQLLHQLFLACARRTPTALALQQEGVCLTYAQLASRAARIAHCLTAQRRLLQPGTLTALFLPRSPLLYQSILGAMMAGCGYVSIDTEYPAERVAFILRDSGATALLTTTHLLLPLAQALQTAAATAALAATTAAATTAAAAAASSSSDGGVVDLASGFLPSLPAVTAVCLDLPLCLEGHAAMAATATAVPTDSTAAAVAAAAASAAAAVAAEAEAEATAEAEHWLARQSVSGEWFTPCGHSISPSDPAYAIYTSGTTGRPKGVVIEHRSAVHFVCSERLSFPHTCADRVLQGFSTSFDASVEEIWLALSVGACLLPARAEVMRMAVDLPPVLCRWDVTVLSTVPTLLSMLPQHESGPYALSDVRILILGGEALPPALLRHWAAGRALLNTYGPTEGTVVATYTRCSPRDTAVTIGRPLPGYSVFVVSTATCSGAGALRLVPLGVPGELCIGGPSVARGYVNLPEKTADRFVANPWGSGRLYRTGDLVRLLPCGDLQFLGRIDQQVKIRGFRVELSSIEAVLLQLPSVRAAAVVVVKGRLGDQQIIAYLVTAASASASDAASRAAGAQSTGGDGDADAINSAAVKAHVKAVLPHYMVPSHVLALPSLPTLPSGKTDHKALKRRPLPTPAPRVATAAGDDADAAASATPLSACPAHALSPGERALARVWEETLPSPPRSPTDDFFQLGGNSLLAAHVVSALRKQQPQLFAAVSIRDLYAAPTVRGMAARLRLTHTQLPPMPTATPLAAAANVTRGSSGGGGGANATAPAHPSARHGAAAGSSSSGQQRSRPAMPRSRYWLCGALQALAVFLMEAFWTCAYLGSFFLVFHLVDNGVITKWTDVALLALCLPPLLAALTLLFAAASVAAKWMLLGRVRPGRHPLWGWFYFRWWLVGQISTFIPWGFVQGTPFMPCFARWMGAKVGRGCCLAGMLSDFDLLTIGNGVCVGKQARIQPASIRDGWLELRPIRLRSHSTVSVRCVVSGDSVLGQRSVLQPLSALRSARVPAGQVWQGSPAAVACHPSFPGVPLAVPPSTSSAPTPTMGCCVGASQAALYILFLFCGELSISPSLLWMYAYFAETLPVWQLLPLAFLAVALSQILFLLSVPLLNFLVVGSLREGQYPISSTVYVQHWFTDLLLSSVLAYNRALFATVYTPHWLRLMGVSVGRRAELSTAFHITPSLLTLGDHVFLADHVCASSASISRGFLSLQRTSVGARTFVGNNAVLLPGTHLPSQCLLGVMTLSPPVDYLAHTHPLCPDQPASPRHQMVQQHRSQQQTQQQTQQVQWGVPPQQQQTQPRQQQTQQQAQQQQQQQQQPPGSGPALRPSLRPTSSRPPHTLPPFNFHTAQQPNSQPAQHQLPPGSTSSGLTQPSADAAAATAAAASASPRLRTHARVGTSWLGSPPMYLPRRTAAAHAGDESQTYNPGWGKVLHRGCWEAVKLATPPLVLLFSIVAHTDILIWMFQQQLGTDNLQQQADAQAAVAAARAAFILQRRSNATAATFNATAAAASSAAAAASLAAARATRFTQLAQFASTATPAYFAVAPLLPFGIGAIACLTIAALKWLLVGRFRRSQHPLWSSYVWRTELIAALEENLGLPLLLGVLLGTPFVKYWFRLLGATVGSRVYFGTIFLTEPDLISIGDEVSIEAGCTIQTHLFEDRVMKMDALTIAPRCSIGSDTVVLYGASVEEGVALESLSLVMKGEVMSRGVCYAGSPASPLLLPPLPPPAAAPVVAPSATVADPTPHSGGRGIRAVMHRPSPASAATVAPAPLPAAAVAATGGGGSGDGDGEAAVAAGGSRFSAGRGSAKVAPL